MLCPRCKTQMKNTMHFEQERQYQYNRCPKCQEKTKNKRIHFEDILKEEMDKQKILKGVQNKH